MVDNGLDWKRSIREAARVLKPGGRFLFVEADTVDGDNYLDYVGGLSEMGGVEIKSGGEETIGATMVVGGDGGDDDKDNGDAPTIAKPLFEEVGYDRVDMVLQPHVAGVAIKAADADLTSSQKAQKKVQEEEDRLAELSFQAFERGIKRRKRKKKKGKGGAGEDGKE